jgi:hypothetical protein
MRQACETRGDSVWIGPRAISTLQTSARARGRKWNIIRRGGNYGWNYREGLHAGPRGNPPAGVVFDNPIAEYAHGNAYQPGVFDHRGALSIVAIDFLPSMALTSFADYVSGHVWALRANGTNVVPFWRLLTDDGIAGFGVDPRNGDVLTADQSQDTIKRLVEDTSVSTGPQLPPTLFHTGAFTNLAALTSETDALTPNAGVAPYDINVPFWSDNARKTRWHFRPSTNSNDRVQPRRQLVVSRPGWFG